MNLPDIYEHIEQIGRKIVQHHALGETCWEVLSVAILKNIDDDIELKLEVQSTNGTTAHLTLDELNDFAHAAS